MSYDGSDGCRGSIGRSARRESSHAVEAGIVVAQRGD